MQAGAPPRLCAVLRAFLVCLQTHSLAPLRSPPRKFLPPRTRHDTTRHARTAIPPSLHPSLTPPHLDSSAILRSPAAAMPLGQRGVNASHPSTPRTPPTAKTARTPSRLPIFRRAAAPNSAPSRPPWTPRLMRRATSTEKALSEGRALQQRQDSMAAVPYNSVSASLQKPPPTRSVTHSSRRTPSRRYRATQA